jgi:hypothetical protein
VEIYEGGGGVVLSLLFNWEKKQKENTRRKRQTLIPLICYYVLIFSNLDSFIFGGGGDGKGKAEERKQVSGFSLYISK